MQKECAKWYPLAYGIFGPSLYAASLLFHPKNETTTQVAWICSRSGLLFVALFSGIHHAKCPTPAPTLS
jgi:hypothetical protein